MPCTAVAIEPVSATAQRLLHYLRVYAPSADRAKTDRAIARDTGIPAREIVDLSLELIRAGHGVVASCKPPYGRFLCYDPQRLRDHAGELETRGVRILTRQRDLKILAAKLDAEKIPVDSTGQRRLF